MPTRQYVGARYVPKFYQNTQNPVSTEWETNQAYEALTIVTYNNGSYTSKIPVPAGIGNPAQNPTYWALTGNYNSQVEEYRQATQRLQEQANEIQNSLTSEINERKNADKKVLLLLGDSWTQGPNSKNQAILNTLSRFFDEAYCYGIDGNGIQDLGNQATTAYNAGVRATHIFIVIGTNNVFHYTSPTWTDAMSNSIATVRNLYPTANIHWFPDNAKTGNLGGTPFYNTMQLGMSQQGISCHMETLPLLTNGNNIWYAGNDTIGVQHLTEAGLKEFARYIMNLSEGGTIPAIVNTNMLDAYTIGCNYDRSSSRVLINPDLSGSVTFDIYNASSNTGSEQTQILITPKDDKLNNPQFILPAGMIFPVYSVGVVVGNIIPIHTSNNVPTMEINLFANSALPVTGNSMRLTVSVSGPDIMNISGII